MTEAEIITELRTAAERPPGVSKDVMHWLRDAIRRTQRLVFREVKSVTPMPTYEIGYQDDPRTFSPCLKQLEPIAYLHLIAKNRGAWVSVPLGCPDQRRRLDMVRKRLAHSIDALGDAAPALADELKRIEGQCPNGEVLFRLPWRADSPALCV